MINMICPEEQCTACNVCANVCPKSCVITEKKDTTFRMIKGDGCIECGLCEEVCPTNAAPKLNYPLKAFAAWSMNQETRQKSASGGIATTLYTYSLENDISFCRCVLR